MNEMQRRDVAAFRYQLIAGVVNRATPLKAGEISAYFREMAQKEWTTPEGLTKRISVRTLERYKQSYEHGGFDALMPEIIPKRGTKAVPPEVLEAARRLREERPERSVEQIIFLLEGNQNVEKGKLTTSTLARYFRREGLPRQQVAGMQNQEYGFRRFEADAPHRLWQSDFHHTLYLPDPLDKNRRRKAKLCAAIDDHSRYIVHGQYYWEEKMPCLEDTLKKAIEKFGIPEQFYVDNGSAFSSKHIANICSRLGIRLSHSTVYRPAGRGKIERVFQFIDTSFKPEAYKDIETGRIANLEDLNRAFQQWLDGYYHQRRHGSTGESPAQRLAKYPTKPLPYGKETLRRFFFLEETRKADKTGCISLNGVIYEVPRELAGMQVQLRYDPFDPSDAEVYAFGKQMGTARLLDPHHNFHSNNLKKAAKADAIPPVILPGQQQMTMFEAAANARDEAWSSEELTYRQEVQP